VPSQDSGTEERPKKLVRQEDRRESSLWARHRESHTKGKIQLDKFYARQMSISENSTNITATATTTTTRTATTTATTTGNRQKEENKNDNENQS